LNPEKDFSPEQLVTIKLRKKGLCGWLDKLESLANLRHQTHTRFCLFLAVSFSFVSLGYSSVVASWQSNLCLLFKLIKIFSDLLGMGAVQTWASAQ